jgi:DNA-directed RNA polymerase subunit beta
MAFTLPHRHKLRKRFGHIQAPLDIPYLIQTIRDSFAEFLQEGIAADDLKSQGLQKVFEEIFPIEDPHGRASIDYVSYRLGTPKYDVEECKHKGLTYEIPLMITVSMAIFDVPKEKGAERVLRDIKEQEIYFGTIPYMTENGTFIVNGTERVVFSQLHRSPGVFFDHDKGKSHSSGKVLFNARVIPYRGSWLDFEFDHKDYLYVRIDRRRKIPVTILLKALGMDVSQILSEFYPTEEVVVAKDGTLSRNFFADYLHGATIEEDVNDKDGNTLARKGRKFTRGTIRKMEKAGIESLPLSPEGLIGKIAVEPIVDAESGELLLDIGGTVSEELAEAIVGKPGIRLRFAYIDGLHFGSYLPDTLRLESDGINTADDAKVEIYRKLRPGDPVTLDTAREYFNALFFDTDRYDLSPVGRIKLNQKLGLETSLDQLILDKQDIVQTIAYIIGLKHGRGYTDDIDHLGNRRVRSVGELLENQYRIGLIRLERQVRERMNLVDLESAMPHELINAKPVSGALKEFFAGSQLSQFMDQINPLSEITHKRRLSALGPGGLTRERAGFEVRDVHSTHYGRICPIETPEGQNIGLISSLALFGRVNEFGFIETPYRVVHEGKVTDEVKYLSASEEIGQGIAQANAPVDGKGKLTQDLVAGRKDGETMMLPRNEITLMDVSPTQLVSVASNLIPFLEHDDANRALMGSNMQRQAVPLISARAPFVGTGMEARVARDSGRTKVAKRAGTVAVADSRMIVVKADEIESADDTGVDIYHLTKFERSNQDTCINQKSIVRPGDRVEEGDVIADGSATSRGELALGQNVLVAFVPWRGYNYEDSILISERLVREDVYTSIHIEEFDVSARDTKMGPEEITRDIPNLSEDALRDLDESGIVRVGAEVAPGDILVGKITPKGETQLSPEEKLLRTIFGAKAGDVRDTSLRVSPGVRGTVIGAQVFTRKGVEKDDRSMQILADSIDQLEHDKRAEIAVVTEAAKQRMNGLLGGIKLSKGIAYKDNKWGKKGASLTADELAEIPFAALAEASFTKSNDAEAFADIVKATMNRVQVIETLYEQKKERMQEDDDLPPGVIRMVKVYIAVKRKIQVGDKMAGRHGNKGVISRVLPVEDMPYMDDGRPVDICLNPLGVPSRMNVGQILETHLGLGAWSMGRHLQDMMQQKASVTALRDKIKDLVDDERISALLDEADEVDLKKITAELMEGGFFATPVFDGAAEEEIKGLLSRNGLPESGQVQLRDGYTGQAFDNPVTVGVMYMLKLNHLVDDKIHARSIGPYSLVTQQPLGGKAQFGGQRLGEMEVWAMYAYGAAYCLQEFLTVKSDDVTGRTRMYDSIVRGDFTLEPGIPESFNVLVKELMGLGLDVELIEEQI